MMALFSLTTSIFFMALFYFVYAQQNDTSEIITGMKIVDADHLKNESMDPLNIVMPVAPDAVNSGNLKALAGETTSTSTTTESTAAATNATSTSTITTSAPTTTTDATPTTPITTSMPTITTTTTKAPKKKRVPNKFRVCSCDLHLHKCDMNCCCDLDCNLEEKKLFSDCFLTEYFEPKVTSHNSHSCFRSNIFYRENSPYYIQETNHGMFCVVAENVDHSEELEPEPKNVDLKFLRDKKPKFGWDFIVKVRHPDIKWEPYKYGSTLLKATGPSGLLNTNPFGLPASFHGQGCSVSENLKFLHPLSSTCKQRIEDLQLNCTKNPYLNVNTYLEKNLAFISNPAVMNLSEALIPVVTATCTTKKAVKICEKSPLLEPQWDTARSLCKNVLESLEITFAHAGIQGISKVFAKVQYGSFDVTHPYIKQYFSSNFVWRSLPEIIEDEESSNATKHKDGSHDDINVNLVDYPRSGNPGYIEGRPILMGTLIDAPVNSKGNQSKAEGREDTKDQEGTRSEAEKDSTGTRQPKKVIGLDKHPSGWMTIHNPGMCQVGSSDFPRRNVLFRMGHQTECTLKVTDFKSCNDLQEAITKILVGDVPSNFSDKYVPAFGNPDLDNLNEWIPVLISGIPPLGKDGSVSTDRGCNGIVGSMKINIAFARVGPVNYPQAKIIGVLYEFGESFNVPRKLRCNHEKACLAYKHQVTVATTVTFLDATQSPTLRIGQWPVVSIKLPQDFFYPFASTSTATSMHFTGFVTAVNFVLIIISFAFNLHF